MKMLNPRILAITSSVTLPMRSNMSTKRTSYYDTLEITPKATQNEIKTAYYKLTKQYHPDRNQSDEAKTKFRDVSEAYNVLGNFEKRKTYDRSLLTNRYPSQQVIYRSTDPKADYYRSQVPTKQSYQSSSFNFDEWTRMHYERTFERQMKLKMESKFKREYRQTAKAHHTVKPAEIAIAIFAMASLGLAFVVTAFKEDYDRINTNNKR